MATATKKRGGKRAHSKAEAIRVYLGAHPNDGPSAVRDALKASKGMAVSAAQVSNVKATMAKKAKKSAGSAASNGHARRKPGRPGRPAAASDSVSLSQLVEARNFAAQVGGVDQAVSLLRTLAKLQ
jgi:hypothetical protein